MARPLPRVVPLATRLPSHRGRAQKRSTPSTLKPRPSRSNRTCWYPSVTNTRGGYALIVGGFDAGGKNVSDIGGLRTVDREVRPKARQPRVPAVPAHLSYGQCQVLLHR